MTALTAAQIAKLNKMNRAAKGGTLGTRINTLETASTAEVAKLGASGSLAAAAADASNAKLTITTGLTAVNGFVAQVRRSGSAMPFMKMISGSVAGTIEIYKDPTYTGGSSIAAGDVATWFAF
jgi:hypothetical protein